MLAFFSTSTEQNRKMNPLVLEIRNIKPYSMVDDNHKRKVDG